MHFACGEIKEAPARAAAPGSPPDCRIRIFESPHINTDAKRRAEHLTAFCSSFGGVGGIRTLGTLLTYTRFPVVLVMTASIPLQIISKSFKMILMNLSAAVAPASA